MLFLILILTFVLSTLTLLTGFGVGTVLTPTFTLLYDIKSAVFLVALVHLANNLLKFSLFLKHVDRRVLRRFGLVSVLGALVGSYLLATLHFSFIKVCLGLFLVITGIGEFLPATIAWKIPKKADLFGGFFSGLMGGLIGNQGAIRSAYLLNYELSKEAFIATGTSIAIVIDFTRIPFYLQQRIAVSQEALSNLGFIIVAAFVGTLTGRQILKTMSLERFRKTVSGFIVLFGILLLLQVLSP